MGTLNGVYETHTPQMTKYGMPVMLDGQGQMISVDMLSEGGIPGGTIPEEEAHSRASVISRRSNAD